MTAKRGEKIEIQVRIVLYSACGVVLESWKSYMCVFVFFLKYVQQGKPMLW
jgi:hypothetical protein